MDLRRSRRAMIGGLVTVAGGLSILIWGGNLLVAPDALPPHSDAVVVLTGSIAGEEVRRQEAMRLIREGRADTLVLSAPQVTYLGEWVPTLLRRHIEKIYGSDLARRVLLCPHNATSTREEAEALRPCLEREGWRTVVVVTSNYHTRRARHIWREVVNDARSPLRVFVHGAADGDFDARGWWCRRRYAKTFLEESIKLTWTYLLE
jgi:uncharacterized SAM-binding protein YcdF (DUF218 family)